MPYYIRQSGKPERISSNLHGHDTPFEEAWLEIPSDGSTAHWLRSDGSLIRLWNNPSIGPNILHYMPVSGPGALQMYDTHLLVDEGL